MRMSPEERFRRKLMKIGKKNIVCRFCIIPVMVVGMFFFHVAAYLRGNGKRFATLGIVLLFSVVYSSFSFPAFVSGSKNTDEWNPISDEAQDIVLAEEQEINLEDILLEDEDAAYEFSEDDWRLILINKQHSIPDGYEEEVPLGNISTMKGIMYCDERIIDDLLDMIQAAKDDDVTLAICSPYRDLQYQEKLFNRKITKYMKRGLSYMEAYQLASQAVTVPNASEHQIGLALDIVTDTYVALNEGFANTAAGKWLAENSCKYGFILRYPKGKEDITGIEYEPWHFRYVGAEAATLITEQGITLEEFWEEYF